MLFPFPHSVLYSDFGGHRVKRRQGDALELSQDIQQIDREATVMGTIGLSYFLERKESEAIGLCEDAIRLCEGLEQTSAEASVYKLYGEILLSADRIDDAERAFRVSLPFYARTETGVAYRQICGSLAVVAAKQGQFSTSQTHLKNCLLDKEPASRDLVHFELVCKRGLVQVYSGELDEARESLNEAKAVLQPLHLPPVCTARFNLTSLQDAIRRGSDGLKPMPRTE